MYKSDYFAYPIDEVEITSTSSNYDNERIEDIVVSIQGKDLLSLDLSDIKSKIRSARPNIIPLLQSDILSCS